MAIGAALQTNSTLWYLKVGKCKVDGAEIEVEAELKASRIFTQLEPFGDY